MAAREVSPAPLPLRFESRTARRSDEVNRIMQGMAVYGVLKRELVFAPRMALTVSDEERSTPEAHQTASP